MYFNKLFGFHTDFNIEIHVQINIEILFLCMVQEVNRIWIIFFLVCAITAFPRNTKVY